MHVKPSLYTDFIYTNKKYAYKTIIYLQIAEEKKSVLVWAKISPLTQIILHRFQ